MLNDELETLNKILTVKERENNNVLHDAQKTFISVSCPSNIT